MRLHTSSFSVVALAALTACATAPAPAPTPMTAPAPVAAARTVQPGAPGTASRVLTERQTDSLVTPKHTAADVSFMTGMISHHQQALVMTALVADRTTARDIRLLALRIELSQTDEINLMKSWLRARGEPVPGEGEHAGHDMHDGHLMPGMLTPEQIATLQAARGTEFEKRFLEFMIQHHEGAITMVAELFSSPGGGQGSEIYGFAADVDSDQQMEIARMRRLLAERP
jgi:uncharacterized protein (DUF305 family)